MTTTLTITSKGQVTLRQDLLKHLGIGPGQQIEVDKLPNGMINIRAAGKKGSISDFIGCLSHKGERHLTIEEMNEITAKGWAGEK